MFEPWLLSNIVDENTNNVPEHLHLFQVLERSGVRVGVIGLVEESVFHSAWIDICYDTVPQRLDQHSISMATQLQIQRHGKDW